MPHADLIHIVMFCLIKINKLISMNIQQSKFILFKLNSHKNVFSNIQLEYCSYQGWLFVNFEVFAK